LPLPARACDNLTRMNVSANQSKPDPTPKLPPFESLLKSRDVEDPVNLWLHRPLAYAFVALVFRTSITPNQITGLALLVGCAAAGGFVIGTPHAVLLGGILFWSSAILDGADGILARAKQMFSDVGRALDGACDAVVALVTGGGAFWHIWSQHHSLLEVAAMPLVVLSVVVHAYLFDYYKEAFMQHSNPRWNGSPERLTEIASRGTRLRAEHAPWYLRASTRIYLDLVQAQIKVVMLLNPRAARHHLTFPVSDESVRIYRQYNRGPMQLWALVSTAPHAYLMSICALFDRLDVYLWIRLIGMNSVFVIACIWQRLATRRTLLALGAAGLLPAPAELGEFAAAP
jgi:CDP-alcohol phosphatidyltransferase